MLIAHLSFSFIRMRITNHETRCGPVALTARKLGSFASTEGATLGPDVSLSRDEGLSARYTEISGMSTVTIMYKATGQGRPPLHATSAVATRGVKPPTRAPVVSRANTNPV